MLVFDSFELDDDDQDDVDDASSARFGRLKKVLCSIIPSHRASESGATLWLYGENSAINDFLRRLFHIATDDAKRWMTFSTHVDGCRLIKGLYWAVGTAKPPGSTSVWIDVATGEARLPVTGPGEGRSHYYRWLADVSERLRWKEIATLAPAIERLTDALATSDPSAADDAPDQALEEFQATVGVESLSSRLESWLRQRFSPKATADLLRSLQAATALREYVACALSPTKRLESLLSTHVACWLARGIAEGETPPASPDDWRAIARIQRYASSPRLDFLASVLSPQSVRERWLGEHRRDAARVRALTSLSDDEYEELWHDCGAREPGWFVCPSLIERLWRVLADWRPSEDEVARLLIALAKFDRQPPRELFERWIAALSPPRAEVVLMAYLEQSGKCRSLARALARRCPARSSRVVEALRFIGAM
jgi:hypothetical protein